MELEKVSSILDSKLLETTAHRDNGNGPLVSIASSRTNQQ